MTANTYYCFIDETKMTEAEWNEIHDKEVENRMFDEWGYWHCNTYEAYSTSFDECMAAQIKTRDSLRDWYRRMAKTPYTTEFIEEWSNFSDCFKGVYGYRPKFLADLLARKGTTIEVYRADMNKEVEAYMASLKKEA